MVKCRVLILVKRPTWVQSFDVTRAGFELYLFFSSAQTDPLWPDLNLPMMLTNENEQRRL
jgi:hypothetical protein